MHGGILWRSDNLFIFSNKSAQVKISHSDGFPRPCVPRASQACPPPLGARRGGNRWNRLTMPVTVMAAVAVAAALPASAAGPAGPERRPAAASPPWASRSWRIWRCSGRPPARVRRRPWQVRARDGPLRRLRRRRKDGPTAVALLGVLLVREIACGGRRLGGSVMVLPLLRLPNRSERELVVLRLLLLLPI